MATKKKLSANGKQRRGFALMSPERQRQIAAKSGRAAHEQGVGHEYTIEEARAAGREGGKIISQDREHMARIGRKGRKAVQAAKQQGKASPGSFTKTTLL